VERPLPAQARPSGLGGQARRARRSRCRAERSCGVTADAALDPFQDQVARIALAAAESWSFALAGGNALVAHGLLVRPTEDVDLFTSTAGGPGQAAGVVAQALQQQGFEVATEAASDGDFVRLRVQRGAESGVLDLARDWRAHPPVRMSVGLVLHRDDAVASKVGAMVGRGLPRDFIDVAAVTTQYTRARLLQLLFERDPGLRPVDPALAMRQLDALGDEDFAEYGLDADAVARLRRALEGWPRDPAKDEEASQVHATIHRTTG
jgi:hypothetical protein